MLPEIGTVLVPTYTPGRLENCPKELNVWSTSKTAERCLAVLYVASRNESLIAAIQEKSENSQSIIHPHNTSN